MKKRGGFTLLEMVMVVFVISVLLGLSVSSGLAMLSNARLVATQQKMTAIDQALMAYRVANDQLPCPSDLTQTQGSAYYGTAQTSAGYCVQVSGSGPYGVAVSGFVAEGGVPVVDLGLPNDFMYDGWGNRIRYAVDDRMANMGLGTYATPSNTNTFSGTQVGAPAGSISVYGNANGGLNGYLRTSNAVYVLLSHGPNGYGAYSANGIPSTGSSNYDECANYHYWTLYGGCVTTFSFIPWYIQAQPNAITVNGVPQTFDDIVTYKERWQMQAATDKPGTLPPAVYVADSSTNSIIVLDKNLASSTPLHTFTSCTGTTAFSDPQGVFADNAGNLWITDLGTERVLKCALSLSGSTWTLTYVGATSGSYGGGPITLPVSVAVDNAGNVWTAEVWYYLGYERLLKLDKNLNFILAVGAGYNGVSGTIGAGGTSLGAFEEPRGLVIDSGGLVWTADIGNNRLIQMDSNGNVLQEVGTSCVPGAGSAPACSPTSGNVALELNGLTMDQSGNIYYAGAEIGYGIAGMPNYGSNQTLTVDVNWFLACGNSHALGMAVDPEGWLWTTSNNEPGLNINKGRYGSFYCAAPGSALVSSGDYGIAIPGTSSR